MRKGNRNFICSIKPSYRESEMPRGETGCASGAVDDIFIFDAKDTYLVLSGYDACINKLISGRGSICIRSLHRVIFDGIRTSGFCEGGIKAGKKGAAQSKIDAPPTGRRLTGFR
jgi:hypothetical protein